MIKLFVIEDQYSIIVASLRYYFRPKRDEIEISGYSATVEEAIINADPANFDLFILDLYIPGSLPVDNIRKLKDHFPGKPIAIYTGEKSPLWQKKMIDEGALTYITKYATREELKLAIQKAVKGEVFIFGMKESSEDNSHENQNISEKGTITPVQKEILSLLYEGLYHKEIAQRLGISRSMVEKILKELRKSFHKNTNMELVKHFFGTGSF